MGILSTIADFAGGGTVTAIADVVTKYFPPSMSDKEKSDLSLKIQKLETAKMIKLQGLVNEASMDFNNRIKDMEGTASDLKSLPVIGRIVIFARGAMRPIWGFATLWGDYLWFSEAWDIADGSQKSLALLSINILVLGFIFGERAVQNIMPFVTEFLKSKK